VVVQIPTGILADYWGPRKLLSSGTLLSSFGAFIFASAASIHMANLGRLIIGASIGVAWISILKLTTRWFKSNHFTVVTGIALCLGILGAISAGAPLRLLMDIFGWRLVIFGVGTITLLLSLLIWIFMRDDPAQKGYISYVPAIIGPNPMSTAAIIKDLSKIFRYRNTWILIIVPASLIGPLLTFTGLWGIPYLTTHYHLSPVKSATLISTLLITCAIGAPVLGILSEKTGRRKPILFFALCLSLIGWLPILYLKNIPIWLIIVFFSLVGIASSAIVIGMAFVKESVPVPLAGTVSGVSNMGMEMGPMILQPAIGLVLAWRWDGLTENGIRIYNLNAYHTGFGLMIGLTFLGILFIHFAKETYCQQLKD